MYSSVSSITCIDLPLRVMSIVGSPDLLLYDIARCYRVSFPCPICDRPCSAVVAFASSNSRRKHVVPTSNLSAPIHNALDKELLQSICMKARIRFDFRKKSLQSP